MKRDYDRREDSIVMLAVNCQVVDIFGTFKISANGSVIITASLLIML